MSNGARTEEPTPGSGYGRALKGWGLLDIRCRIEMLGGLRARCGDREMTRFGTTKNGALLAYLAYHLDRPHPREVLAELLWPWSAPSASRRSLRVALSSLRRQLEPPGVPHGSAVVADRFSVRLNAAAVTTDVAEFDAALQAAHEADSDAERIQCLAEAADLYGGSLLPGYYQDWIIAAQERLADRYFEAVKALTTELATGGQWSRAVERAQRLVALDPLREDAHLQLILLLAQAGQVDAAKRQFSELERILREEFGESPSPATREMLEEFAEIQRERVAAQPRAQAAGAPSARQALPQGTVTFLLVDIDQARQLRRRAVDAFQEALADLARLLQAQLRRHRGYEVRSLEGRFTLAFVRPSDGLDCALASQQAISARSWPPKVAPLQVRMALDTGEAAAHDGAYGGQVLDRATGLLLAAHGGQILASEASAVLLQADARADVSIVDLGYHRLRGRDVPDRVYAVAGPDSPTDAFPLPRAALAHRSNVPAQLTRFFGRERELEELQGALLDDQVRMVTLTGPGGSGKTRLAMAAAEKLEKPFAGAVWFVPFEQLAEPELIPEAIVSAMGLPLSPEAEALSQAVEVLSRQPALLVIDNFEHLVDEGGPVIGELLRRTPTLKYLVTSRHCLFLSGETEFSVEPLPVPGAARAPEELMHCPSAQLFVDRAQTRRPDFQVTAHNADYVAELCDRLEGLPLALELAAGWVGVLSPARMVSQLDDRFGFLVGQKRDVSERHQTLEAAVDWSYELLPEQLQRFFARLSVFRGGLTTEAAEAVCQQGRVLGALRALRERSLVVVDDAPEGTAALRFRLLETLREYGWGRLSEEERADLCARHAQYFLALAQGGRPLLAQPDAPPQLKPLTFEHDNLRAALSWAASPDGNPEVGLRLATAVYPFWVMHGHLAEGRTFFARLLAHDDVAAQTAPVRAHALDTVGYLARIQADFRAARSYLEEALAVRERLGDEAGMPQSLSRLALVAMDEHDFEAAEKALERSRGIAARLGMGVEMAQCLMTLGSVALNRGDDARAEALTQQALTIGRQSGDTRIEIACLRRLGGIAFDQSKYEEAQNCYHEAVSLSRKINFHGGLTRSLNDLGSLARKQRQYAQAQKLHEQALAIHEDAGNTLGVAETLDRLGQVAFHRGRYDRAQALHEEALLTYRETGFVRGIPWTLHHLGAVALRRGDLPAASGAYRESITRFRDIQSPTGVAATLDSLAEVARAEQDLARMARLLGAADAIRRRVPRPTADHTFVSIGPDPADCRSAMGEDAFAAAWAEGQSMSAEDAIAYALTRTDTA